MADKDFAVKLGLVVNTNLIYANSAQARVGIGTNAPDTTLTVAGNANVQGNVAITNGVIFSNTLLVQGATTVNNNLAVNGSLTMTTGTITGTVSNATNLNSQPGSYYTNATNITTGTLPYAQIPANVVNTTANFTLSGNTTINDNKQIIFGTNSHLYANGRIGPATYLLASGGSGGNLYWTTAPLTVNTTAGTGAIQFYDGTTLAANANLSFSSSSDTLTVNGSSATVSVGNSTVNGSVSINSTAAYFTGTSYNASNLANVPASSYVNTSGSYTLGGQLTLNNQLTVNAQILLSQVTANGSQGTVGYVLVSGGLGANAYWANLAANTSASWTWTNTHTFSNTVTLSKPVLFANTISANGSTGTAGYALFTAGATSNAYWNAVPTSVSTTGGAGAVQYYDGTTLASCTAFFYTSGTNTLSVPSISSNGTLTVNNSVETNTTISIGRFGTVFETTNVSSTALTGAQNVYVYNNGGVVLYTANATANWYWNIAANSSVSLNTAMATGSTLTIGFIVPNGNLLTYYPNDATVTTGLQIDGVTVTPKWYNGVVPNAGYPGNSTAAAYNLYLYNITKTASATYTVFATQTKYA